MQPRGVWISRIWMICGVLSVLNLLFELIPGLLHNPGIYGVSPNFGLDQWTLLFLPIIIFSLGSYAAIAILSKKDSWLLKILIYIPIVYVVLFVLVFALYIYALVMGGG